MEIRIITQESRIPLEELRRMASAEFGDIVKAVVDVAQGIMAVGGELHADEETLLTERAGSRRADTWGINLYPNESGEKRVEFDSMINLKPSFGNRSRDVEEESARRKIREVVAKLVIE